MCALASAAPLVAASDDAWYQNVYQRGLTHFQEGSYDAAIGELRVAAFGFIDSIPKFETAEAYVADAALRAQRPEDAHLALQRIVAAEKIDPHFATLAIPSAIRSEIEGAAPKLLTRAELARLKGGSAPPATTEQTVTITDPVVTTPPETIVVEKPVPEPVQPPSKPQPVQPPPVQPQQAAPQPPPPQPQPTPQPQPAPASAPTSDPASLITQGDRAIGAGDLATARQAYAGALASPNLGHASLMKIGEGLYRARAFRDAAAAFDRAGAFAKGEEPFHYYNAVALYETGQYAAAKRELAAALPYIEITPDVDDYRAKIEGAIVP